MSPLRRLYECCGLLSGLFLVAICVIICVQIIARLLGTLIPASDEFAAYAMAASGFLGLPFALHRGAHIRVGMLFKALPAKGCHAMEVLSTLVGLLVAAYLAWHCTLFVFETYSFNEVSTGMLPIPLWIPQSSMVVGTVVLVVAMTERLVTVMRGRPFETVSDTAMSE